MKEQSVRIQTSVLNALEKKVLICLAKRQPRWMTSDKLTVIGIFLIRQIMNEVKYEHIDGKNILTLEKKLN